jgi:hypothetical protein
MKSRPLAAGGFFFARPTARDTLIGEEQTEKENARPED